MTIERHERNGVVILDAAGRLTAGRGEHPLADAVERALHQGSRRVLIDMSDVSQIDASGLTELVNIYMVAAAYEGQLELEHVAPGVRHVLDATELAGVVPIFDEESEALAAFGAPRPS